MTKFDQFWLSTASLLYSSTAPKQLVSLEQIRVEHKRMFKEEPPQSLEQHLISWKPRYKNKHKPSEGGSRRRYLFRTDDGFVPDPSGQFRLYKNSDSSFNGEEPKGIA